MSAGAGGSADQGGLARWSRLAVSLVLTFQAAAMLAVNFPTNTALSDAVIAPFRPWLTTTSQWQMWDMFDTIPYDHQFEVRAYAVDVKGTQTPIGPVLPDLTPDYPNLRLSSFYYRIYPGGESSPRYWDTYSKRLCAAAQAAAKAAGTPAVATVFVDFVSARTRSLAEIRKDGRIANLTTTPRGPVHCEAP